MKTIRINRKKWLRGIDNGGKFDMNYLWCPDRKAGCCLGHAIHQTTKCARKDLAFKSIPSAYYDRSSFLTEFINDRLVCNALADEAMVINDEHDIGDALREEQLTELFRSYNIKLEFYN